MGSSSSSTSKDETREEIISDFSSLKKKIEKLSLQGRKEWCDYCIEQLKTIRNGKKSSELRELLKRGVLIKNEVNRNGRLKIVDFQNFKVKLDISRSLAIEIYEDVPTSNIIFFNKSLPKNPELIDLSDAFIAKLSSATNLRDLTDMQNFLFELLRR